MSTSHYSRPYRATSTPPNTRRFTAAKLSTIGTLLIVDVLAFGGAEDLSVATTFAVLAIVNCWILAKYV